MAKKRGGGGEKPKRGRPPGTKPAQKTLGVRFDLHVIGQLEIERERMAVAAEAEANIHDWTPSLSDVVRSLVAEALDSRGKRRK